MQREIMITEAKDKKIKEIAAIRKQEILEVKELKKEIEKEQKMKLDKRRKEKEDAQKVILLNEQEKVKRLADKEKERVAQIALIEEYNEMLDKQEK
jgi:hypothetical protein